MSERKPRPWAAPLLIVSSEHGRTRVAGGVIRRGEITWRLPSLPAVRKPLTGDQRVAEA